MEKVHFWQGEFIDDKELENRIQNMEKYIEEVLGDDFPLHALIKAADKLSKEIYAKSELYNEFFKVVKSAGRDIDFNIQNMLSTIAYMLQKDSLEFKMERELGSKEPFTLKRITHEKHIFEGWSPLGFIVHVAPSNVFTVGSLGLIEGLLSGNFNFVKTSGKDTVFPQLFAKTLCEFDITEKIRKYIIVARISSKQSGLLSRLFSLANGISAWGSEESISKIKEAAPKDAKIIEWGHKISFAYIAKECLNDEVTLKNLANDVCLIEQQACSSPQVVYLETDNKETLTEFGKRFSVILDDVSKQIPRILPDSAEKAEITTITEIAKLEACLGETEVIEAKNKSWRILIDIKPGLVASPLYRSIWIKPLQRKNLLSTLWPLKSYLQTVGLGCSLESLFELSDILFKAGALRINKIGEMLNGYSGEPHDGGYALPKFSKRVSLQMDDILRGISTFKELKPLEGYIYTKDKPILTKKQFQSRIVEDRFSDLFFRSGGSTGKPVMSVFTYDDYHTQMEASSYGLYAAGLDPQKDRAINLFAAGNLYGGFLSFFTIMEFLKVPQFPMALVEDFKMVGEIITNFKINSIIGLPSYIIQLFKANSELFKKYNGIEKIFYGGDHLSKPQIEFFRNEFNVKIIRSAAYGSNDAGPMGYQCPYCEGSIHHLLSGIQHLEIFKVDEDIPADKNETGRLIFTNKFRKGQEIIRYEIGDIGRWIYEPCKCGRREPRFELLGRTGDVFKCGGPFLNYQKFVSILSEQLQYHGNSQIHLSNIEEVTGLNLLISKDINKSAETIRNIIIDHYNEVKFCLESKLNLEFQVQLVDESEFITVPQTGKIKHIIDNRMEVK